MNSKCIGRRIFHYKSIDSTQKEIYRRIEKEDILSGDLIIADIQTNAIGTHGRRWYTDRENNIAFSLYVDLGENIKILDGITIRIAEILKEIFKVIYDVDLTIKEPNDLILNRKKIGGILTETKVCGNIVKYIVLGIGINTNQLVFDENIENIASSIKKETKIIIDNNKIIKEFLNRFAEEIDIRIGEKL